MVQSGPKSHHRVACWSAGSLMDHLPRGNIHTVQKHQWLHRHDLKAPPGVEIHHAWNREDDLQGLVSQKDLGSKLVTVGLNKLTMILTRFLHILLIAT